MPATFDPVFPNCNQHVCRPQWYLITIFFCRVPGHYDSICNSTYGITIVLFNSTRRLLPSPSSPPLCLFFCRLPSSSAARHPPPDFVAKFSAYSCRLPSSSPPALVTSSAATPSGSSHRPPASVRARTSPPPSSLQPHPHPDRSHCSVRFELPALGTFSARRRHCHLDPLLAPTAFVAPSADRSRRAVPPPARQHRPRHCRHDVLMQSL